MHRRHLGDGHPVAGDRRLGHPRELRPDRPFAQHQVLLPGQGGRRRRHRLRLGAQFTTTHETPTAVTNAATSVTATGATLNGTVNNENNTSSTVTFCYKTTTFSSTCTGATSVTATQSPVTGSTATPVSYALTGLAPNTKYYFQVKAATTGNTYTVYGSVRTFTTTHESSTAVTNPATSVSTTSATLNGTVNNENNTSSTVTFCYKATTTISATCTGATSVTATPSPVTGASATPVSYALIGLAPNTKYYFRVEAATTGNTYTVYGTVKTFTTTHQAPTATTNAATSLTATGATLNGTVNNENNTSSTVTFCYKTSAFTTCSGATSVTATQSPVTGASATPVSYALTGLAPNTKYYFQVKAVSTGNAYTVYGSVLTFTTLLAPTATTDAATNVTATRATLNGTVNNENNPSTTVTFCYKTSTFSTCSGATSVTATQSPVTGGSATPVSYALTGLTPNTEYFFRVEAVGGGETVYSSSVLNFTTTHAGQITNTSCSEHLTTNTHIAANGCTTSAEKGGTSLTLYAPSDVTVGDVLVAQVTGRVASATVTPPSGWTNVASASINSNGTLFLETYYCVVLSGDKCGTTASSWSWSWTGTAATASGGIMQFSGVTTTTPVDVAATTHDTTASAWTKATAPSVTTTVAYDEIVVLFASGGQQFFATGTYHSTGSDPIKNYYTGRSTNTASAGGSEYAYESDSAGSASTNVQSATAATNTFTLTVTAANNSFAWDSATIALRPS